LREDEALDSSNVLSVTRGLQSSNDLSLNYVLISIYIEGKMALGDDFETLLAMRCSPVLLGKKPGALFARPKWWDEASIDAPKNCEVKFLTLTRRDTHKLIFVYSPFLLAKTLASCAHLSYLKSLGYSACVSLDYWLSLLRERFASEDGFPHEIGFFLGYPPEDVCGFIKHRGERYKFCGQWKVYGDVDKAIVMFEEYSRCTQRLLARIRRGGSIWDAEQPAMLAESI
jgi:hypothetical protein